MTATDTMTKPSKLRENLIAIRMARGWSQSELSRRARVGQSTISRIESGTHVDAGWSVIESLARALGVDPNELVGGAPTLAGEPQVAVGQIDVGELLRIYIASDYFRDDAPTTEEMQWLAGLGVITWTGAPPTAGTVHVLLGKRRDGKL